MCVLLMQEKVLATLSEWQADPATSANVTVLLVAGLIYTNEENYVEALRAVHGGHNLEMCAPASTPQTDHILTGAAKSISVLYYMLGWSCAVSTCIVSLSKPLA